MLEIPPTLSPTVMQIAIFALVTLSVGGIVLAAKPRGSKASRFESRMRSVAGTHHHDRHGGAGSEEGRRRRMVEDTLRQLEAKHSAKAQKRTKPTLRGRMRQAGLRWSEKRYFLVSVIAGVVSCAIALGALRLGLLPAIGFGVAGGLLLPHLYVTRRRSSRLNRFGAEFPYALDVIVRGVKAGLPLTDCLKIIAAEAQEPVRSEFNAVVHDQTLGVPLNEAVERLAERVPLSETNFFAIVLAIQTRSGGNLSEALGNLTKVLRERKNLRGKIKAMSAEAKASAGIIGSMPVVVAGLLYLTSPDYISLLFQTSQGNIVLAGCAVWMLTGSMVMRKMINFDF